MKIKILSDKLMKEIGFNSVSDNSKWYLFERLKPEISFNFTIIKDTEEFEIDILDESFLQPYDFQYILKRIPDHEFAHKFASEINDEVIKKMLYLQDKGVIEDYEVGDYI